jgi:NADH-quinone oxidoreductase subunit A
MLYYPECCAALHKQSHTFLGVLREVRMLEYVAIAVIVMLATLIALIAIGLGTLFGPKKDTKAKNIPYESGIVPYGEGTRRMPIRFYLIAVLFILFDIEVIFFLPWAIVFRELKIFGLIEMVIFVVILLVGYVYAWKKGALEWE